jgi:hypothetical protein
MAIAGGVDIGNVRADCRTTRIKARALHDNSSRRLERLERGCFATWQARARRHAHQREPLARER